MAVIATSFLNEPALRPRLVMGKETAYARALRAAEQTREQNTTETTQTDLFTNSCNGWKQFRYWNATQTSLKQAGCRISGVESTFSSVLRRSRLTLSVGQKSDCSKIVNKRNWNWNSSRRSFRKTQRSTSATEPLVALLQISLL